MTPPPFVRNHLWEDLDQGIYNRIVEETKLLLKRRFAHLAEDFDSIEKTNFNPFLLLITAPVYNLFSPFEVAERLQLAKAFHGDDTAFGKFGEEKLLPLFGLQEPPEKRGEGAAWEPIDRDAIIEGVRYLFSIKAGPWTPNQSHANAWIEKFPKVHEQTGAKIVIGVMYGKRAHLNNKPSLAGRELGSPDWLGCVVGAELWEFVSGVKDVHRHIFSAIRDAQKQFADELGDESFQERLMANRLKISSSLRKKFDVTADEDFWQTLFNNMF